MSYGVDARPFFIAKKRKSTSLSQKPRWMDPQTYDRMPASIEVRKVHVRVSEPGFRTESFVVVTTLTDAAEYSKDDLAELYHSRWQAELDIRAIKITMGMDIRRCKTPEMVRREMWTCLLAYNLIRQTLLGAAQKAGVSPRGLSFTAAVQSIAASRLVIALSDDALATLLIDAASASLAEHVVGNRSGRLEPRAVKRRPKPHALLTKPRAQTRGSTDRSKTALTPMKTAAVPFLPNTLVTGWARTSRNCGWPRC